MLYRRCEVYIILQNMITINPFPIIFPFNPSSFPSTSRFQCIWSRISCSTKVYCEYHQITSRNLLNTYDYFHHLSERYYSSIEKLVHGSPTNFDWEGTTLNFAVWEFPRLITARCDFRLFSSSTFLFSSSLSFIRSIHLPSLPRLCHYTPAISVLVIQPFISSIFLTLSPYFALYSSSSTRLNHVLPFPFSPL